MAMRKDKELLDALFGAMEEVDLTEEEVDENLRTAGYDPVALRARSAEVVADIVERTVFRSAAANALPGVNCWAARITEIVAALQAAAIDPAPLREEARVAREKFLAAQRKLGK